MKAINPFALTVLLLAILPLPSAAQSTVPVLKQLPQNEYNTLRTILYKANAGMLKDTVLIHYQFADAFEKSETDDIIQQQMTTELRRLHAAMATRKNFSIVFIGEPGPAMERSKEYNNLITEDKDKKIFHLLFSGNYRAASIMLLPDRKCLLVNLQDKWGALDWSAKELHHFLAEGQLAVLE